MLITSSDDAFAARRPMKLRNGGDYMKSVFMGAVERPKEVDRGQPQAYVVAQAPGTVVEPHYHAVHQWQVVVEGEGTLGRYKVAPISLHFTDPYTAYGPIVPGEQGVAYFSMRAMSDTGAYYLDTPGVKEAMRPSRRRFLLKTPADLALSSPQALAARTGAVLDAIIEPYDDGVAGYVLRIGPGGSATAPDPAQCGGQYVVVVGGSIVHAGRDMPRLSTAFVTPTEASMVVHAGPNGAEVLVLQYPRAEA
jgi:hypothetical protein